MRYTIDQLLADLGTQLPLMNGEEHRRLVMRTVRRVLRQIGYNKTARVHCLPMTIDRHYIQLPDSVVDVEDAGPNCEHMCGEFVTDDMHSNNPWAFQDHPDGLYFPNLMQGIVSLRTRMLPADADNQPTIDDDAYDACRDMAKAALIPLFAGHPLFGDRYQIKQDAERMVTEARATFNKRHKAAKQRTLRRNW